LIYKFLFLYIKKHIKIYTLLLMDRGVKASELIRLLQSLISQYGDLDVFKERNGNARPIYFAEYYQPENHFELT